jgi:hypothetical protein
MYPVKIEVKINTEAGPEKINVWAGSLKEAEQLAIEKRPGAKVLSCKVSALTIYDIKYLSCEKAPYFFNKNTMKFFKQTLASFRVRRHGPDKFYLFAKSFGGNITERIFDPFTRELEHITKN